MKLQRISPPDYQSIRAELEELLPDSFMIHNALLCYEKFGELNSCKFRLYRAVGEGLESFLILRNVCSQGGLQSMIVFWDTEVIPIETVEELLLLTPDWDWTQPFIIPTGSHNIDAKMRRALKGERIYTTPMAEVTSCCQYAVVLNIEEADIHIPEISLDFVVKRMPPQSAHMVLKYWDVGRSETLQGIEERLSKYFSYGAFKKKSQLSDECEETPVAWTLQYAVGTIGMTYTLPDYRNRGLGAAVTLSLAKDLIDGGHKAYVSVDHHNPYALSFHQKIGFKVVGKCGLIIKVPEGMKLQEIQLDD